MTRSPCGLIVNWYQKGLVALCGSSTWRKHDGGRLSKIMSTATMSKEILNGSSLLTFKGKKKVKKLHVF